MDDLKQLVPTVAHGPQSPKPPVPEKLPLGNDDAFVPLKDMIPSYSAALKSSAFDTAPASPSSTSEAEMMGFTKIELPSSSPMQEEVDLRRGPRQALPKGLVATRFANLPTSHQNPHSPASTVNEASWVEHDLIDFESGLSFAARRMSIQHMAQGDRNGQSDATNKDLPLYREVRELRKKLKSSTARAEIAEEKAEIMQKRIEEIKSINVPDTNDYENDMVSMDATLRELKMENSALKEQLRDAQSHIFSLQPYRKELTPEEVGRQYDDLIEGITDWVSKFMGPLLQDHAKCVADLLIVAGKRPTDATRLKRAMHSHPDLVHGSTFPETDEDIIIAIIMRFLYENIFQKILYGSVTSVVESISFVEISLQNHVDPKRDLFAIRTWTAEAYNAILSAREFRGVRERRMSEMTTELATLFRILCKKDRFDTFCKNFEAHCVKPAMQLYEKIQVSTHHFYFDIDPFIMWGNDGDLQTSPDFHDSLLNLDCKNILQNRKNFSLAKIDPTPSKKELYHCLLNVCTVAPALFMRQVGRKDVIRAPQLVRRQQMLVAWGPPEKRDAFVGNGERTVMNHLYAARSERERAEAGGWTPFRWGG